MSTANDIVRRGLRLLGVLRAGQEPKGADAQDGLERLQSLILNLPGLLHNGRWCEVAVTTAYTARESDRCTVTAPGVVTLPTTITNCGPTRPPLDLARVQIIGTSATNAGLWLYSATNGAWGQANALTLSSTMPFGAEDDEGLAAILAVNMAGEYGAEAELSQRAVTLAKEATYSLRSRLKKAQPIDWTRPEPLGPLSIVGEPFGDYFGLDH